MPVIVIWQLVFGPAVIAELGGSKLQSVLIMLNISGIVFRKIFKVRSYLELCA